MEDEKSKMEKWVVVLSPALNGDKHWEAQSALDGKVGAVGGGWGEWRWRDEGQHREGVPRIGKEFV